MTPDELIKNKIYRFLKDEDKFVRFRIAWLIEKLPVKNLRIFKMIERVKKEEKDKIMMHHLEKAQEKIMMRYYLDSYYKKDATYVPVKFRLVAKKVNRIFERIHSGEKIVFDIDLDGNDKKLAELIDEEMDNLRKLDSVGAKASIARSGLWFFLVNWEDYNPIIRYNLLRIAEESFDMRLDVKEEEDALSKEARKQNINEEYSKIKNEFTISKGLDGHIFFAISCALKDPVDFIRYRAAGVVYRIIKMTKAASKKRELADIKTKLEETYNKEQDKSIRRKIAESLYLCNLAKSSVTLRNEE
jgi:uncharacterized glyoxalase superfamily protein PhnB